MALLLLCKRGGVQLAPAAYFSKSSSSSTSTLRCISRSLAESRRVVNNRGSWGFGAVRGYNSEANSSLSNQTQKIQLEVQMLRNELERMQFQFEKLRDEIKKPPSGVDLRSEIIREEEDASSLSNNQMEKKMQQQELEIEKLRNENEKRIKESSSEELQSEIEKLRNEILRRNKESSSSSTSSADIICDTICLVIVMCSSVLVGSALGIIVCAPFFFLHKFFFISG